MLGQLMEMQTERDERIFGAIRACWGIPTATYIAGTTGMDPATIKKHVKANKKLRAEIKRRTIKYVRGLKGDRLLEHTSNGGWMENLPPYASAIVYEKLDAVLRSRIEGFDGIPTVHGISGNRICDRTAKQRIAANPKLEKAIRDKTKKYLESIDDNKFLQRLSEGKWAGVSPYAKSMIARRVDRIILDAIEKYDDVPTLKGLEKRLNFCQVHKRVRRNQKIRNAMRRRGLKYLDGLSDEELKKRWQQRAWLSNLPAYAQRAVYQRIDDIIIAVVKRCKGLPTPKWLEREVGYAHTPLTRRIRRSKRLAQAIKDKTKEFLDSLGDREFVRRNSSKEWTRVSDYAKLLIKRRLDATILKAIEDIDIPNDSAIHRKTGIGLVIVGTRTQKNRNLQRAIKAKTLAYLDSLTDAELIAKYKNRGWSSSLPDYAKPVVNRRIDGIILEEIDRLPQDASLSPQYLAIRVGLHEDTIEKRIETNPKLWVAYYHKKGLSIDQALELEVERKLEQTDATGQILSRRLANLYAFREMVGIVRCFGNALGNAEVLEISLYPGPLGRAATLIGQSMNITYCAMQPFRRAGTTARIATQAQAAVIQGIHRLASEGLTRLFEEVHRNLGIGKTVIATYGLYSALKDRFEHTLLMNGFEIREHGLMILDPPSSAVLLNLGVKKTDLEGVENKIYGSSHVMVLRTVEKIDATAIPELVNLRTSSLGSRNGINARTINIPLEVNKALKTTFLQTAPISLSAQPFLVEVEKNGRVVALLGYDMHPRYKCRIESAVYPGAPAEDYRALARKLATNLRIRQQLGVVGSCTKRIPLQRIRQIS